MTIDSIRAFFSQFNWVDILVVILLLRIAYAGLKSGFPAELFKLLGVLTGLYLSLHYYTGLSSVLIHALPVSKQQVPVVLVRFVYFLVLAILGYQVWVLIRNILSRFMKMEAVPNFNKWGGFVLSLIRGFLFVGLVVFILLLSDSQYFRHSVKKSYFGPQVAGIAPNTYAWLWESILSKFRPDEQFNKAVEGVLK